VSEANDTTSIIGRVEWELRGPDGELKAEGAEANAVTEIGDRMYAERGAGVGSAPAVPTGMKLGTGSTAVTKTGAGAVLTAYLGGSAQPFDATYPTSALNGTARRITYRTTFAAGEGTSAVPITEAVLVNEALTDATSAAGATVARLLLSTPVPSKAAADSLTLTWTHDLGA
jgi:hypothetical protein